MKKRLATLLLASVGLATVGSAEVLMDYQFNDTNGTEFQSAAYSTDVTLTPKFDRDGNDEWVTTDGSLHVVNVPGRTRHQWTLDSNITSGVITTEVGIASYDLSGITITDDFRLGLKSSDNKYQWIGLRHNTNTVDTVTVRSVSPTAESSDLALSSSSPVYFRTVADLDTRTGSAYYSTNGSSWIAMVENAALALSNDVFQIQMLYDADDLAASDYIDVDYMTVTHVIPEPATLGMVAAMGAGILFIRRRFMI